MKKLLAILLSMLMLCTMIPFATVFAAGEHYIELVADAEEVNAGDEITVEVSLYGHEDLGLIGAQIELGFDPDVFELVTYYDEDEEMWIPPIEVATKFNVSSNKYIMFPPIDEETGYMKRCLVQFLRATATATQAVKTNLFYTVTFRVKDDAVSGDYEIDVINYNKKNIIGHGNAINDWTWEPITITVNGTEPDVPSCEHEYTYACDKVCALCGELTNEAAEHNVLHVEAVEATCYAEGNIEYWYCDICGAAWTDELCREVTNLKNVIIPVSHNVIHVAAKDATCTENGNIEYWYCGDCGFAWLDELCIYNTNLLAVVLPYVGHQYDDDMDVDCNVCGDVRVVKYEVKTFDGNSIQESSDGLSGLAFKFKLTDKISGLAVVEGTKYIADYSNVTVTPDSTGTYKLVKMGALVSNGTQTLNVPIKKWILEGDDAPYYSIRIINIPQNQLSTIITCTPYFEYENAEGELVTVYGDSYEACAADFMG